MPAKNQQQNNNRNSNLWQPWAKYDAKPYEWLYSEDSFERSIDRDKPVQIFQTCQYSEIEHHVPYWSIENPHEPAGYQDLSCFDAINGKRFKIAKRLVDLHGAGFWQVGDLFTLQVRGCCSIVNIIAEETEQE